MMDQRFFSLRKKGLFFFAFLLLAAAGCGSEERSEYIRNGLRLQEEEKYKEAIAEFSKEIKAQRDSAKAYLYRGRCYIRKGDLDSALADYDKAIGLDPKYAEAYQARAALCFARFNYKRSWDNLKKARDLGARIDLELLHGLQKESGMTNEDFFGIPGAATTPEESKTGPASKVNSKTERRGT